MHGYFYKTDIVIECIFEYNKTIMTKYYQNYDRSDYMIEIRPVSDLRNKFTEIESTVKSGAPVYLTKNGYGSMVVMSIEAYSKLTESFEESLDIADMMAERTEKRYTKTLQEHIRSHLKTIIP